MNGKLSSLWRDIKKYVIIAAIVLLIYELFENLGSIKAAIDRLMAILAPFIQGLFLTFIINMPMRFLERKLIKRLCWYKSGKLCRPLSMVLSYIFILLILAGTLALILPRIMDSAHMLAENFGGYVESFKAWLLNVWADMNLSNDAAGDIEVLWERLTSYITRLGESDFLEQIFKLTVNVVSVVINAILAIIISAFMLFNKEKLICQCKKLVRACFKRETTIKIFDVAKLTNDMLNRYIAGQVLEATILGTLCFIGLRVLSIPYALLISVVIGITALIPILGAWIGTIPSVLIVLIIDPVKALWFLIFILILQQLENNLIYPRVVGNAMGLSGLWVLMAVIIGGGLFGILGVLLGVPITAVLYRLTGRWVNSKQPEHLRKKC